MGCSQKLGFAEQKYIGDPIWFVWNKNEVQTDRIAAQKRESTNHQHLVVLIVIR